ncbi:MAG: SoxR reducing system RseC family protein [Caulobacteraceae bacterium]
MEQIAKVISSGNGIAKVEVKRTSMCGENCANCKAGCPKTSIYVDAINHVNAAPDQYVKIETKSKVLASAVILTYVFPLFMLTVGILLGNWFFSSMSAGMKAELYAFLTGIAFMVISYLVVSFIDKKYNRYNKAMFTITKIL